MYNSINIMDFLVCSLIVCGDYIRCPGELSEWPTQQQVGSLPLYVKSVVVIFLTITSSH